MSEELYTRKGLAFKLNISIPTICRWEKLGLPVIRIGGIVRYDLAEVTTWITLNNVSKMLSKNMKKLEKMRKKYE